jgi:septum formation protein
MHVVLASGSPRRRSLLESVGISLDVRPPKVDETLLEGESPADAVKRLAELKAEAVSARDAETVLAADTVVALDGTVFGKPADRGEAIAMLDRLSGARHDVWTGWCVGPGPALARGRGLHQRQLPSAHHRRDRGLYRFW